jgi:N-acetylglucosaminyl-diphospho-decaprenol L-rhamnosyltransferase
VSVAAAVRGRWAGLAFATAMESPVRVIVVHHDRPAAAVHTVDGFLEAGARVTVIDSGSAPANVATLRRRLGGRAEVVPLGANVGFGPGANAGLRRWLSDGTEPWAIVAPHDARPTPGCVDRVIAELAARPRAAMACAEYGPGEDFKPTIDKFFGGSFVPTARGDGWEDVDYPHGTLLAMRREAIEEIGLFDERFFAYCEEADLGMRARAAGWGVGLIWGAVVANGKPPRADIARYLQLRNTLLLLEKHFGFSRVAVRLAWEVGVLVTGRAGPTTGVGLDDGVDDPAAAHRAVRRSSVLALRDYGLRRFGPPPADVRVAT